MILDEYGAEDRSCFCSSVALAGIVLAHRVPEFEFQILAVPLNYLPRERRYTGTATPCSGTFEDDTIGQRPQIRRQVDANCLVSHVNKFTACQLGIGDEHFIQESS